MTTMPGGSSSSAPGRHASTGSEDDPAPGPADALATSGSTNALVWRVPVAIVLLALAVVGGVALDGLTADTVSRSTDEQWWVDPAGVDAQPRVVVCGGCRVTGDRSTAWDVTVDMTMPADSALLRSFREAQPGEVAAWGLLGLTGWVVVDGSPPVLDALPVIETSGDVASVRVSGTWEGLPDSVDIGWWTSPIEGQTASLVVAVDGDHVLGAVQGGVVTAQGARRVVVQPDDDEQQVTLHAEPTGGAVPHVGAQWTDAVGGFLRGAWYVLLPVLPVGLVAWRVHKLDPRPADGRNQTAHQRLGTLAVEGAIIVGVTSLASVGYQLEWFTADTLLPWSWGSSLSVSGILALLVTVGTLVSLAQRFNHGRVGLVTEPVAAGDGPPGTGSSAVRVGLAVVATLALAALIPVAAVGIQVVTDQYTDPGSLTLADILTSHTPELVAGALLVLGVTALCATAGVALFGASAVWAFGVVGLLYAAVVCVAPTLDGADGHGVGLYLVTLLLAVAVYATMHLVVLTFTGTALSERPRVLRLALFVAALFLARPFGAATNGDAYGWSLFTAAAGLARVLVTIAVGVALVASLRDELVAGDRRAVRVRGLAIAFGALVFFTVNALVVGIPLAWTAGVVLLATFLLRVPDGKGVLDVSSPEAHKAYVHALADVKDAERSVPRMRRTLASKVEAGDATWQDRRADVDGVRAVARTARTTAGTGARTLEETALGSYQEGAWQSAVRGAQAGFYAGLPWMLLAVPGILAYLQQPGFSLLTTVSTAVLQLLRWPAYGFFFGACYPLIRGSSGLAKGFVLFLMLGLPNAIVLLVEPSSGGGWRPFFYVAGQLFVFSMVLGLGADLWALVRADDQTIRLVDVHNLRAIVAWGSGVTAAVGATAATALATGLTTLVLDVLQPQAPAKVPGTEQTQRTAPDEATTGSSSSTPPGPADLPTALLRAPTSTGAPLAGGPAHG